MNRLYFNQILLILLLLAPQSDAAAQTEKRIGVEASKPVSLTLREAVTMALENNRDIEVERLNVQLNEYDLKAAKGFYDPSLSTSMVYDRRNTPVASLLAGGDNGGVKTTDFTGSARLSQSLPWQGGRASVSFDQNRATTQNLFYSLNPQFTTGLNFEYTQPLWRNRKIDAERRQIKLASRKLDLSDSQFRQRAIEIIAQVERAYWDLVFARRDEEIKRESVELARTQLEQNERQVAEGALARADVISARVEIERRTDEAEAALEAIGRAENALKAMIAAPKNSELWSSVITPAETPMVATSAPIPFDDALRLAFQNRPEMEQYRLRGELNKIDVDYFRNQTRPQIDLVAGYGTYGLSGKERAALNPISASQDQLLARVNTLSGLNGLAPLPSFPIGATPSQFIGGYGQSLGNMFQNDYRSWRVGLNITLPLGNRTAKAHLGRAIAEGKQLDAQKERTEQTIELEVRNAVQAVDTARRRVDAARNSRENAELQYQSEKRKFDAGQTTNYFVLDRQNALSMARGRELKALTDYTKATAELQRATSLTLVNNNVALISRR